MTYFVGHEELQPYEGNIYKFFCDICGFAGKEYVKRRDQETQMYQLWEGIDNLFRTGEIFGNVSETNTYMKITIPV